MGDIVFNCKNCGQQLIVDAQGIGLELPCPLCAMPLTIPGDATPVEEFSGEIHEEAAPELLDSSGDEERTQQMLDLLQQVVGDTSRVEQGISQLSVSPPDSAPAPSGGVESKLAGRDALEQLAGGLSLLKSKLGQMSREVETAGQRISDLTQLSNSLKSEISEGKADKRRLKEEISDLTKAGSQRIDLSFLNQVSTPPPVQLDETPPTPTILPLSVWRSPRFLAAMAGLAAVTAGAALLFFNRNLPGAAGATSPPADFRDRFAGAEAIQIGQTLSFGSARLEFAPPYMDKADAALLGEVPPQIKDARFLVLPVTITNVSSSQPLYLKYLWADAELQTSDGLQFKPVRIGNASGDAQAFSLTQMMEPGNAMAENLVFALTPTASRTNLVLNVLPGIWARASNGTMILTGRTVALSMPNTQAVPPPP